MNNLNSHGIPVEGEMWMTSFLARRLRSRTIRIFSAFSLIVPTQCNLKFSLLHWKSYSAEKNYYNSWISDKLKAKMDKVSGPIIGPTRLRYFQWENDVFKGENCKNPKAKIFLRGSRHFFHVLNMDGEKFWWKIQFSSSNWTASGVELLYCVASRAVLVLFNQDSVMGSRDNWIGWKWNFINFFFHW